MKKFAVLALAGILAFGLIACGKDNVDNQNGNNSQTEDNQLGNTDGTNDVSGTDSEEDVFDGANVSVADLKAAVVEAVGEENYWPAAPLEAEFLEGNFGISADMYDEFLYEMPMISMNVDTLLIVKAKEDQVQAVEDALNAYRDDQIENGMNYPMNVGKVQASRIETFGNYVCFVQLGADVTNVSEQGDEAVIEHCQQENEKALDAIEKALAE